MCRPAALALSFVVLGLGSAGCVDPDANADAAADAGILIMGNGEEPKGLDPHLVSGVLESNIIRALFEGLCVEHPSENGVSLPGAAQSWEANEDFTEWTFHLQPDGKWSDGKAVTTDDFLFAYERILSEELAAKYSGMLFFLENGEAFHKGEITDFSEVGVSASGPHTLHFKLRGPTPFLPELTKHYTWYPVPRHAVLAHGSMTDRFTQWTDPENLVSNGPFKLKEWVFNRYIVAEKSPTYWDADVVKLNEIRYLPIKNVYTEARMFFDNQLHVSYTLASELIAHAKENYAENLRQETYLGTYFIRCNVDHGPLRDVRVRQALGMAIDRPALIENVLKGGQKPALGMVPPFGDYQSPETVVGQYDPELAKQLMAEAGYPGGKGFPDISLLITDSETSKVLSEALQAMWEQTLGIRITIRQMEWATYLNAMQRLDYDLGVGGWIGDYLDPTTFLEMWIKDGGNNNTSWSSVEYETLLREAEQMADPAERFATLQRAETLFLNDWPTLPIFWYTRNYLLHPRLEGWHPLLLDNHPFKFLHFSP
ncbi:MAG: peptide ABC transporter substrate-binding protein [Verrucomicrobiota bacterium]